jgi:FtsZ-interacting cell division protein ZipA
VGTTVIVLIVVIVLLVLALAAAGFMLSRRKRSEQLQEHYGPEYERTLASTGDRRAAEAELTEREKRHRELDVRDLRPEERDRFAGSWTTIQREFVDDPVQSVRKADALVVDIMRTRGYPVDDFERRAEDLSVKHPQVVERYREAREIRLATESGAADTEQQRHAVTSYRTLIEALLGNGPDVNGRHAITTTEEHTR